jgi:hypothetical protein
LDQEATISEVEDKILKEIFNRLHQQREADFWKKHGELLDNDVRIGHDFTGLPVQESRLSF